MSVDTSKPKELLTFLQRVDAGYKPTEDEIRQLEEVRNIDLSELGMTKLPRSLSLMKNAVGCDLAKNRLTSLSGIEGLTRLTALSCSNNRLKSLAGIEKLTELKTLGCWNNNLVSLSGVEGLSQLDYLNCSENRLTDLHGIENLSQLTMRIASATHWRVWKA